MKKTRIVAIVCALVIAIGISTVAVAQEPEPSRESSSQPRYLPPTIPSSEEGSRSSQGYSSVKIDIPLDIVLVQDETGSMDDDIEALRLLAPQIWDSISGITSAGFRMSVVGFRDFAYGDWGEPGDWVYRRVGDFTNLRSNFIMAANSLTAAGGNDGPEAQYPSLYYLFTSASGCIDSNLDGDCADFNDTPANQQPDFRSGAQRIVLLATDAPFHEPTNTPGYPGPQRGDVINALYSNRAVLIGLVPGGQGKLADVDELARLTGGSTQDTGGTGQDVANAILAALGAIRPVSAELSYATVTPAQVLADGMDAAVITVFLRDTAGLPVVGKSIYLESNRGLDIIVQPTQPTNLKGEVQATLRSIEPGVAQVRVTDVSSGIQLSQVIQIEFIERLGTPTEELLDVLEIFRRYHVNELNAFAGISREAGKSGDKFRDNIPGDVVSLAFDAVFGVFDVLGSAKALNVDEAGQWILKNKWPGVVKFANETSWTEAFNPTKDIGLYRFGKYYDDVIRKAAATNNWNLIMWLGLSEGTSYLATQAKEELGDIAIEKITNYGVSELTDAFIGDKDAGKRLGNIVSNDARSLATHLDTRVQETINRFPEIDEGRQTEFAADLRKRTGVAIALGSAIRHQAQVLTNLEAAYNSTGEDTLAYFFLKFAGTIVSGLADGASAILYNAAVTSLETTINLKKLETSQQGFVSSLAVINDTGMTAKELHFNALYGLTFLQKNSLPEPVDGEILQVRQVSERKLFWIETNSYADVEVTNQTDKPLQIEIVATYGYNSRLLGLPWAFIPLVTGFQAELAPRETRVIRIYYKQEEEGGSPDKNSWISFSLLAHTDAGTYFLDSYSDLWDPQPPAGRSWPTAADADLDAIPVVENPIDVYLTADLEAQNYTVQIWLTNPFTQNIQTQITQTLPVGAVVLTTDGTVAGETVTWNKEIAAYDIEQLTVTFKYSSNPGTELVLSPATMSFVYQLASGSRATSDLVLSTESNSVDFTALPSLDAEVVVPIGTAGITTTLPVTITNFVTELQTGNISLTLSDELNSLVYTQTIPFGVAGTSSTDVSFSIPSSLPAGTYSMLMELQVGDYQQILIRNFYLVLTTQQLSMKSGWNLISVPFAPLQSRPTQFTQDASVVLSFEGQGLTYDPLLPEFSNLESIDAEHGYWVYALSEHSVFIQGLKNQPLDIPIALEQGWNLISYLPEAPLPVTDALVSISGKYDKLLGYDGGAASYYTDLSPLVNTLTVLEPGRGYWIHMIEPAALDYSKAVISTRRSIQINQPQSTNGIAATNEWINVYSTASTYNGQPLPFGSTVSALGEDGRLLGQVYVRQDGAYGLLAVYGDDAYTAAVDGARVGETIRFLINGQPATITNGVQPVWSSNGALMQVDLSAAGPIFEQNRLFLPDVAR